MMKCVLSASCVMLLFAMASCSNKEQVFEGMYKGMSSAEESRMSRHPSYGPLHMQENDKPSYQEYTREREQEIED